MSTVSAPDPDRQEHAARLDAWPAQIAYLLRELDDARSQLADSEETLRAIRHGEVDVLVVAADAGEEHVFTLSSEDRPYRNFVENMSDGAATVSVDGIVLYANQAFADLVGLSSNWVVGRPVLEFLSQASRARVAELIGQSGLAGSVEATLLASSGETVPVRISSSSAIQTDGDEITCLTVSDLTRERLAEASLAHSAQHDGLTDLPNRTLLTDRLRHALERRRSDSTVLALLFCDVDGFKNINDAYGHQIGDDMLRVVAERLSSAVRPGDTVARIGGDEFVILCETLEDFNDAATIAYRASAAGRRRRRCAGRRLRAWRDGLCDRHQLRALRAARCEGVLQGEADQPDHADCDPGEGQRMNPGGLVLIAVAVIAGAQLFAGNALQRLRILPSTAGQTPTSTTNNNEATPPGVTVSPSPGPAPNGSIVTPGPQTQAQPGPAPTPPAGG
ncbi:MAG TPA: diguanylate cyclase [Acidothermaceae bacterium]|jgi:PAS domain S-box-containing protein